MIGTDFWYDDVYSKDMGIYLVKLDSGFIQSPFLGDQEIISETIVGEDIPYVFGTTTQPLKLKLILSPLEEEWTTEKRREVARWISNGKFNKFYSEDDPNKWYYIMHTGTAELQLSGLSQGYVEFNFQNISPFTYSPIYEENYDFSTSTSSQIINLTNHGDLNLHPIVEITKVENGSVSIYNLSNGGEGFTLQNLVNDEIVTVDNKYHRIETTDSIVYRYDDFTGDYLSLPRGVNRVQIDGKCKLKIRFQYQIKG